MTASGTYKIRPAGRHILTIGKNLIQNSYAAILELVKNAYDADSPDVTVEFQVKPDIGAYSIIITDHGHGMSRDTVVSRWMVPSTKDKAGRERSPSGRIMQGQKGIGRYAASVLGKDLLLETVTAVGEKTTVYIEWSVFENARYLDDVEIPIETKETHESSGTRLTIANDTDFNTEWNKKSFSGSGKFSQLEKLEYELKKLTTPPDIAERHSPSGDQEFRINLEVTGFSDGQYNISRRVKPFPLLELFDYRIAGRIGADGENSFSYTQQNARNMAEHKFVLLLQPTGCGELLFDIRVFDRETEAVESLIKRGLKDESGNYMGLSEARRLLNAVNGIGVYRNGFRIRPFGDADLDWLELNRSRIQNPTMRIGSNQVIGYIQIQSEKSSDLIEKSARDGLIDNKAFDCLKNIAKIVIAELEVRRYQYRKLAGLSRTVSKIEQQLERLSSHDFLKKNILDKLTDKVDGSVIDDIIRIINQDASNKNKINKELGKTAAIYQGQATIGKIINVVLHEGRRPLNYFQNQIPRMRRTVQVFRSDRSEEGALTLLEISEGIGKNAENFVVLFRKLDPLATGSRSSRKPLVLKQAIADSLSIFENELKVSNIAISIDGSDTFTFTSWRQDITAIFTNLADNSIYWINNKNLVKREISIVITTDGDSLICVDYRDTGPGIEPDLITSAVIFEPHFSTKPDGTGLGLSIAGEAAARNGLELKALESGEGARFILQPKMEVESV
jgi:signal transduction histidine kinase